MEKIAILTIASGKYIELFENLRRSIFTKFLTNYEKTIFLFTDVDYKSDNVKVQKITHLPWPLNTLLRFYYFNKIINQLKDYDVVYYIDSDMIVYDFIDCEIIPTKNEIISVKQYWYENLIGTYETTNKKSTAYVEESQLSVGQYCQACFFGANYNTFSKMNSVLNENINQDLKNNIIAIWHDESHFNKYILSNSCKRLHTGYAHPTNVDIKENKNTIKLLHINSNGCGQ